MIVVAEINVIGLLNHSASRYAASNPFPTWGFPHGRRKANVHTFNAASHSSLHERVRSAEWTFAPCDSFDFRGKLRESQGANVPEVKRVTGGKRP